MAADNETIASLLDQTGELLEIEGGNRFRALAYRRAARIVKKLQKSVVEMLAAGEHLDDLPGIGDDLARAIASIAVTGRYALLDRLKRALPGDLAAIAALPGIGPKRLKLLRDRLQVISLDDLRRGVGEHRLRNLDGFGRSLEDGLREALQMSVPA